MDKLAERAVHKLLLVCPLCSTKFSVQDIRDRKLVAETGICIICYNKMAKDPMTCFGKRTKGRRLGYDENAIECKQFCPDKNICREMTNG